MRSTQKELMDLGPSHYTQDEYEDCLKKLFLVGKYTGMHRDTFKALDVIKPSSIIDVGCGDGAYLALIAKRMPDVSCKGIDISSEAIGHAQQYEGTNIKFLCTDNIERADLIMANLVCHHLTDPELSQFLQKAYAQAHSAILINDLQRHKIALLLFSIFSRPLFANRLISHDGKVSIKRGFYKSELISLIEKLNPHSYSIRWRFPFRWQVIIWKK